MLYVMCDCYISIKHRYLKPYLYKQVHLLDITTHKVMITQVPIKLSMFLITFQEHKKFRSKFGELVVPELFITMA